MTAFIALDWGTSSFRAYLVDSGGNIVDGRMSNDGILTVEGGGFEAVLERQISEWDYSLPVMASGMITSKQGWTEVPYCPCPAGVAEIAAALHMHRTMHGRLIAFVPGLSCRPPGASPDVMRGEETQILGDGRSGLYVLPGTHSKWAQVRSGRVERFMTFMTGEIFAAMKDHTILGRLMVGNNHDPASFTRGVELGLRRPELVLNSLFTVRTLGLFGDMRGEDLASYLSGILLGVEIAGARHLMATPTVATILGSHVLVESYVEALKFAGIDSTAGDPSSAVAGLAKIGRTAGLLT